MKLTRLENDGRLLFAQLRTIYAFVLCYYEELCVDMNNRIEVVPGTVILLTHQHYTEKNPRSNLY